MRVNKGPITLPDPFQKSFSEFPHYPTNLMLKGTGLYPSVARALKTRLEEHVADLCLSDEDVHDYEVPIRDLQTHSTKVTVVYKENIHTPEKLSRWLGAEIISFGKKQVRAHKRDPACRFVYIYAENSRDQLKITRSSLTELLTYHQVMPVYLDFMLVFGSQHDAVDLRFSGFRELDLMKETSGEYHIPDLGRSGRQFQLCYSLKGITKKVGHGDHPNLDEWSIRQAAIHHQFDVVYGTTLWIVTKGRTDIKERFKELTGSDGRPEDKTFDTVDECFRASLSAHLLYCYWSTEDWRWYIRSLERLIDAESSMAIYGRRRLEYGHKHYEPYDIQDMQYWQDKTNEMVMILETNVQVISSLRRFYLGLMKNSDFPLLIKEKNEADIQSFSNGLADIIDDFGMQISRAKLLARIIMDRKELVAHHLQGQVAERTEELNLNLEREAIGMRIITIMTLVYLPATFTSTFFSTDVVKFRKQGVEVDGGEFFSELALKRWLQVTLPLTILTLLLAWVTYKVTATKTKLRPLGGPQQKVPCSISIWKRLQAMTHNASISKLTSKASKDTSTLPVHENDTVFSQK